MRSALSLVSEAAKQGVPALNQLFVEQPDTFIEAVRWLAPIDSERWCQPLTMAIVSAVTGHIDAVDFHVRRKACEIIVKAATDDDGAESLTLLSSLLLSMRPLDEDALLTFNEHAEFEQNVFDELKRCRWTGLKLVRILYFLRDLQIDSNMVDAIVANFHAGILECVPSDIPSSCYNFIFLSEKLPDHCLAITRAFISACDTLVTRSQKFSLDSRTNVLHAISTAANQNYQLVNAVVKLLKSRIVSFRPFAFALLLSLMDSHQRQTSFTTYITSYALDSYRTKLAKSNSKFFRWVVQQLQKCDSASKSNDIGLYEDFDDVIDQLVQSCVSGWEFFIPNLVEVCFQLLELYDKSCQACHRALLTLPVESLNAAHLNPNILAIRAGLRSLISIFKSYSASRSTIVERVFQNVLSNEQRMEFDCSDDLNNTHFSPAMFLLGELVAQNQVVFFDAISQIRNSFDHLMNMPSHLSCQLIRNLMPIIKKRKDLNDALVITVRKSLFSRHLSHRIMAVDIIFTLINSISGVPTSSQFSQCSSYSPPLSTDSHLFLEFKGLILRVLSQQPQIRAHLYECLQKCFQSGSLPLRKNIFDLLKSQLSNLLIEDHGRVPFSINLCVQSGTIVEPLPVLLHYFCQCVMILKSSPASSALYENGQTFINSIVERLSECHLEDFAFEKAESAKESQATASVLASDTIVRDNLRVSSLFWLEIHEVAINYLLMSNNELSITTVEKVMKCHKTLEQLKSSAFSRSTAKRKCVERSTIRFPYLCLRACNSVLGTIYGNFDNRHGRAETSPDIGALFLGNPEFVRYCLSSAIADVEKSFNLIRTMAQNEIFLTSCCDIAPKLFRRCLRDVAITKERVVSECPDNGKSAIHSLNLLCRILSKVVFFSFEAFNDFCRSTSIHQLADFEDRSILNPSNPELFFEALELLFNETCNDRDVILPSEALQVISMLEVCIPFFPDSSQPRYEWLSEVYRLIVSEPVLSSNLLGYGYTLRPLRVSFKLLFRAAQDCIFAMGDIDEQIQPTMTSELGFICEDTVPVVVARMIRLMDSEFVLVDWLLSNLKLMGAQYKDIEVLNVPEGVQPFPSVRAQSSLDSICFLIHSTFEVAHQLIQIRSKNHNIFKLVLSFLIRTFKYSFNVVTILCSMKRPASRRFTDMVAFIGSTVNPAICSMIKFNQEADVSALPQSINAAKKRIEGEKRLLPDLTNHMEKFEYSCIKYSKLVKGARLDSCFSRAAAFDFRFSISKALADDADTDKRKKKKNKCKDKHVPVERKTDDRTEADDGVSTVENKGSASDEEHSPSRAK